MYSKVEKPKESKSRAVANSVTRKNGNEKQGFGFVDNRPEALVQRKLQAMAEKYSAQGVFQLRPMKYIADHARKHYSDGWGAAYGITDDSALKAAVPDAVKGQGSISLGEHDAPAQEQNTLGRIKSKECSIGYEDNKSQNGTVINETKIYACGPKGPERWRDAPSAPEPEPEPETAPAPVPAFNEANFPPLGAAK